MIFSTVGEEEDRDVERRGSSYITRREFVIFVVIALAVILAGYQFVISPWKERRDFAASQSNLHALNRAIGMYAEANNDGLPPILLAGSGDKPYTWANQLFEYIARKEVFKNVRNPCEGNTLLEWRPPSTEPVEVSLSYGMLTAADTLRRYEIRDETILLAETIGGGAAGSYNPLPLDGRDGYAIGYDNSNGWPNESTKYVTRLAFRGSGGGPMGLTPVHSLGTVAIRADGKVVVFAAPQEAFPVMQTSNRPTGPWVPF